MIGIKKVQVVPLDINYGKIIDSFSTTDDKTTNAPSLNAVSTLVEDNVESINGQIEGISSQIEQMNDIIIAKGDFASIEFEITTTQLDTSKDIAYPDGFTKDNTNVVSILSKKSTDGDYVTYSENETIRQSKGSGFRLFLKTDNMVFHILKGSSEASNFTAYVKILLMKIETEVSPSV